MSIIKTTSKPCKGTTKAKGFGCGEIVLYRKYGLCRKCLVQWSLTTEQGNEYLQSIQLKAKKQVQQEIKREKKKYYKINKNNFYSTGAWVYFSRYVKLNAADSDMVVTCVTSGRKFNLMIDTDRKNLHAGHYKKVFETGGATNYSTAFMLENCYPQSKIDNVTKGGNSDVMKKHIIETHGIEMLNKIKSLAKTPFKLDKHTLDEIRLDWKIKYKRLVEKTGFDPFN